MTMFQGGLFDGNENAGEVSATYSYARSESKKAKYYRAYRSDPENKNRINSNKRRRKALKKEKELNGNISPIFEKESGATPTKVTPQTVENPDNHDKESDNSRLANCGTQANDFTQAEILRQLADMRKALENQDRARDERLKNLEEAVGKILNFPENPELAEANARLQAMYELRKALDENRQKIDEVKSASRGLPVDEGGKQNASSDGSTLAGQENLQKNPPASKKFFFDWIAFVPAVLLAALTGLSAWFVAIQTAPLYESLEFPIPMLTSYGALSFAIAFSAIAAITRKNSARFLMALMLCYELLLVIAGTKVNQSDLSEKALRANPMYAHAADTLEYSKDDYEQKKARYEDQNSKVYKNAWFKRKVLGPARDEYTAAVKNLEAERARIESKQPNELLHLILKVLFRLCAIVLTVMLAESSIKLGVRSFQWQKQ